MCFRESTLEWGRPFFPKALAQWSSLFFHNPLFPWLQLQLLLTAVTAGIAFDITINKIFPPNTPRKSRLSTTPLQPRWLWQSSSSHKRLNEALLPVPDLPCSWNASIPWRNLFCAQQSSFPQYNMPLTMAWHLSSECKNCNTRTSIRLKQWTASSGKELNSPVSNYSRQPTMRWTLYNWRDDLVPSRRSCFYSSRNICKGYAVEVLLHT